MACTCSDPGRNEAGKVERRDSEALFDRFWPDKSPFPPPVPWLAAYTDRSSARTYLLGGRNPETGVSAGTSRAASMEDGQPSQSPFEDENVGTVIKKIWEWFLGLFSNSGIDVWDVCESVCEWNGGCDDYNYLYGRVFYYCGDGSIHKGGRLA